MAAATMVAAGFTGVPDALALAQAMGEQGDRLDQPRIGNEFPGLFQTGLDRLSAFQTTPQRPVERHQIAHPKAR